MTKGKSICNVLKTIRTQIAKANEIKYEPRECHYEGECRGTCPACEAEVRYIQRQLDIRRKLGKAITIVGISAGLSALTGCAKDAELLVEPVQMEQRTETKIFGDVVEQMPMYPGGQKALMEYLAANVRYPEETCAQGRVVVSFVVERDGSITEPKVVRSIDPTLDKEALRVVNAMPKWIPGSQNGTRVRTRYTIPITFRIK